MGRTKTFSDLVPRIPPPPAQPRTPQKAKTVYELELHKSTSLLGWTIMRVPGGWIYDRPKGSVFVPLTEEGNNSNLKL